MWRFFEALKRVVGWGRRQVKMSPENVVFITGCDSGLGFALSVFCHSMNMTVISACHNIKSEGAKLLRGLEDQKRMITIELDLLQHDTIIKAFTQVSQLLEENDGYEFTALVNNAGVMCFGDFEFQTSEQIEMQINVNLLGTIRLTKEFLPLIRQQRGRIINVTSHCGLQALPTLGPYAASKAALRFWNDSLRMEMHEHGVEVINFIPGSFITQSNITAKQRANAKDMWLQLNKEQRAHYAHYFFGFLDYLNLFTGGQPANAFKDDKVLAKFKDALTNVAPKAVYVHEPWRYKFYTKLFGICPTPLTDWLAQRFCAFPMFRDVDEVLIVSPTKTPKVSSISSSDQKDKKGC